MIAENILDINKMSRKFKTRMFEILEIASVDDFVSKIFDYFIMTLILLNVLAVILETVHELSLHYKFLFNTFELFSVVVFTIEYLFRFWTCTIDNRYSNPIRGRIRFAVTPLALVDLFAILPFYLPILIPFDLRFIRSIRLFRLFRLLKLGRYSESSETIINVLKAKKEELIIAILLILLSLLFASSLMYFIEHDAQPQAFSSIPAAMWWGVSTLTTVGYGDIYPITPIGKFFGGIIIILGVVMFALPAGIFASGFTEELQKKKRILKICPHCGNNIEEPMK